MERGGGPFKAAGSMDVTKGRLLLDAGVTALVLIRDVLVRAPLRDRRKYPHVLTYIHGHTLEYVRRLGSLYEQAAFK